MNYVKNLKTVMTGPGTHKRADGGNATESESIHAASGSNVTKSDSVATVPSMRSPANRVIRTSYEGHDLK